MHIGHNDNDDANLDDDLDDDDDDDGNIDDDAMIAPGPLPLLQGSQL